MEISYFIGGLIVPETLDYYETGEFDGLTEEEIVFLAKNKNDSAIEYIVKKYTGFIRLKLKSYFLAGGEHDDVLQEGMIGLYKAVRDFDCDRDVSFRTFAELCITRNIITAVKSSTRKKHSPLNSYISLDKPETDFAYFESANFWSKQKVLDPEQIMIERENIEGMEYQIDKVLSSFEAEVLMFHLNGYSYSKIAEVLGKDLKSVDNALQRIKRKVEKLLKKD